MQRSFPALVMFTVFGCLVANDTSAQVVRQEMAGVTELRQDRIDGRVRRCDHAGSDPGNQEMGYTRSSISGSRPSRGLISKGHTAVAKAAGIPYYHIPFSVSAPDPAAVDTFFKTIMAPGVQPSSFIERAVEEPPGCGS